MRSQLYPWAKSSSSATLLLVVALAAAFGQTQGQNKEKSRINVNEQSTPASSTLLFDSFASWPWTASSSFLSALAAASSSPAASFVPPQLSLSNQTGLQMAGPTQNYQTTGLQSLSTFSAPFTVSVNATATEGTADPFEIFLASADLSQFLTVTANMSPTYDGMWATAPNISQLWQLGETFSPQISPALNTLYKITITVDSSGTGTVTIRNSGGPLLGTASGLQPGTGPFYLVLGQRIGNAPTGNQMVNWSLARITTP